MRSNHQGDLGERAIERFDGEITRADNGASRGIDETVTARRGDDGQALSKILRVLYRGSITKRPIVSI